MSEVLVAVLESDGTASNAFKTRVYLIENPTIVSITPTRGFANQMQDIRITGTNFHNLATLHVKAEFSGNTPNFLIDCLIISNELVIIKAPNAMNIAMYNDRTMNLHVSTNGFDYSSETITYTFMDEPHMVSMTDSEADYQGNIDTEIIGLHFTSDVTDCVFGKISVSATYNATTGNIACTAPPYDTYGDVQVQLVFFDSYVVNNTLLYFTYLNLNLIEDFTPKEGHVDGGTIVQITGNFTTIRNEVFQIYFGGKEATVYEFVSDYLLEVESPPSLVEQDVEIKIVHGDDVFTTGSQLFSYKLYFQLSSIFPEEGPSRGGSVVQFTLNDSIYGTSREFNYCEGQCFCIFGKQRVPAITISVLRVDCKSPANSPGTVDVELGIPGIYQTASGIQYTYNKDISVLSVTPVAVPLQGGTLITITGLNFLSSIKLKITETGTEFDVSEYVSSSEIKFIAPESISTGEKSIFLSNNEQDYYQRYDYPLIYFNGIVAISVSPEKILIGSDTEITITGVDFSSGDNMLNAIRINDTIITSTVIDSQTIKCSLPSFDSLTEATKFELFLTINLQDYYGGLIVEYILPPILESFTPGFSNSHEEFFSVNITGQNFQDSNGLECYLSEHSSYTILYSSSTSILWFFSTLPSNLYDLKVSNNFGNDFTVFDAKFEVIRSIQVLNVHPNIIVKSLNTTGSNILVTGRGFRTGIKCVFEVSAEGYTFDIDNIVDATLISSTTMICSIPDITLVGSNNLLVKASLSNNLRLISQSGAELKIVDKAPKGFYFYDETLME